MIRKYIREDVRRRAGKFVFLVISVAIGVAAVTGILSINISAQEDLNRQLESFGANMVIYPRTDDFSLSYGGISLASVDVKQSEIPQENIERIYEIPDAENINIVSPKVVGIASGDAGNYIVVGVDFEAEKILKGWWKITGDIPTREGEILLGFDAFERSMLGPGQEIELDGKVYRISGYIEKTDTQDDNVIFMELSEAQEILGKEGMISFIEVMAFCDTCPIDEIISQIESGVPNVKGVAARQLINAQMELTTRFLSFGLAVSVFILVVAIISLTATMVSFVKEKTKEIGIMRAIGFRKKDIGKIIVFEVIIVAILAGVAGYVLGQFVALFLGSMFLDIPVAINMMMLPWAFALSIMVCSVATVLPLRTASGVTVVEALRSL